MPDSPEATLKELLLTIFKNADLRRFLGELPKLSKVKIERELPDPEGRLSVIELVDAAYRALLKHDAIDQDFFDELRQYPSARDAGIELIEDIWLRRTPRTPPRARTPAWPSRAAPHAETFDPFAVQICGLVDGQLRILASGAVIAPRVVLTARHALKVSDAELQVRPNATANPVGVERRELPDDGDLDVALLVVKSELCGPTDTLARPHARRLSNAQDWVASGYLVAVNEQPSPAPHAVAGKTLPTSEDAVNCHLDVQRGPRSWAGLSGAAVRVGDEVVAVVRSVAEWREDGRINATPVGRFVEAWWFLNALGSGDARSELQNEAEAIIDEIRQRLAPCPTLREALKLALDLPSEHEALLARALVGGRADEVVTALNLADEQLDELRAPGGDREALWLILERVLPHAIDWQPSITQARQRALACRCVGQPEPNQFELSCRTETVAEIVLAGVDGRHCAFVPLGDGESLSGVGFLAWPAASVAPIRQTRDSARDAIVQKLASELGVQQGAWVVERLAEATKTSLSGAVDGIIGEIEARLAFASRSRRATPRRRHLLVIDDELGGPEAGLSAWQVVTAGVGHRLPSLRLVHLTGSAAQRGPETTIAAPIEALYKARNPR